MVLNYVVSLTDLFASRALWVARAIGAFVGIIPFTPLPINILISVFVIVLSGWLYGAYRSHRMYFNEVIDNYTDEEIANYRHSCQRHHTQNLPRRCMNVALIFSIASYLTTYSVFIVLPSIAFSTTPP